MQAHDPETFDIVACADDDVLSEFQITIRYGDDAKPISVIIDSVEIADAKVAAVLQRAISGVGKPQY